MYIQINTITQEKQRRDFYFHIAEFDLEHVFDLVQKIAYHDEVVNFSYFDRKGELPVSLETIYSPVYLNPIRQLRQQWESILASSAATELNERKLSSPQNEPIVTIQQKQLRHYQQVQEQMQQLLETTQATLRDGPQKKRLVAIHEQTIQRCLQSIVRLDAFFKIG